MTYAWRKTKDLQEEFLRHLRPMYWMKEVTRIQQRDSLRAQLVKRGFEEWCKAREVEQALGTHTPFYRVDNIILNVVDV